MDRRGAFRARAAVFAATLVAVVVTIAGPHDAGAAARRSRPRLRATPTTVRPPPAPPKSWVLVDVGTGRLLAATDPHTRRRPASTIKLLTVLTADRILKPDTTISVSALAASMPARNIGLVAGQTWPVQEIVESTLVVSANDAAVALAETAGGGSLDGFASAMQRTATALGVVDAPVLVDPSGLDNEFAHGGGDWISAWDLAIVGLAALRDPVITRIAKSEIVRFDDPRGQARRLVNHNKLLTQYPGATGLKTGYTLRAGNTLVATATRGGRTMLVVVLDAPDLYGSATALLDQGFATDGNRETGLLVSPRAAATAPKSRAAAPPTPRRTTLSGWMWLAGAAAAGGLGLAVTAALGRRRRRW